MKRMFLSAAALVVMLIMASCSNDGVNTPSETSSTDVFSPSFVISDLSNPIDVYSCTEDNEPFYTMNGERPDDRGRGHQDRRMPIKFRGMPLNLGRIVYSMQLDEEQKATLREFMSDYHDCMVAARASVRELIDPIMQEAREERRAIMEALKEGELTREEAKAALDELNAGIRLQIEALNVDELYCACLLALLENIQENLNLTEEQLEKFLAWYEALEGPCFGTTEE